DRRCSSFRQTATARRSEPSDRLPARLLRWAPRRRIAYLAWADRAWADRVRRPIVSLDTACTTARGGAHHKAKTGVKGRTAYRKFKGDCLKKIPALTDAGHKSDHHSAGMSGRLPRTGLRGMRFLKIPRASARGRGCESVGKWYAGARYGDLPFPLSSPPPPSGD